MLDKSNRNKFFCLSLLLLLSCCGFFAKTQYFHTEMICPNRDVILVRYVDAKEMREAVVKALALKRKYRTSENYTVIRLAGNRSFKLEKISPEESLICQLRQIPVKNPDKNYIDQMYNRWLPW